MLYDITLSNPGGVLDTRTAKTPQEAAEAVLKIVSEVGELHDGDVIRVAEVED